jgi:pyrroloquinoline-quinone synthase
MSTKDRLDQILTRWNLLNHPFYQAWSAGTLPVEALRAYAREYGAFINMLPRGWETLQDEETAAEEREHAGMWASFAGALGTQVTGVPVIREAADLTQTAAQLFSEPSTALGGLYAFESQQPATAQSKLDGLRAHYRLPAEVEPYFEVHSHNEHEARKILAQIEALPPAGQEQAEQACSRMAEGLWNALSGIYGEECMPG